MRVFIRQLKKLMRRRCIKKIEEGVIARLTA